jgi:alanine racemase
MDYTLLDLTSVCQDKPPQHGEEIVILGAQGNEVMRAEELAKQAGTIAYEIVSNIRQRVPREAV